MAQSRQPNAIIHLQHELAKDARHESESHLQLQSMVPHATWGLQGRAKTRLTCANDIYERLELSDGGGCTLMDHEIWKHERTGRKAHASVLQNAPR